MTYLSLFIITLSFSLQLISAFVAVRLIAYIKKPTAGMLVLFATSLMIFDRSLSFYRFISRNDIDLVAEITACIISLVFLWGLSYLNKLVSNTQREITKRRQAEETLRETTAKLQALIDAIPDMVIFKDAAGRHLVVNKTAEKFIGLRQEELKNRTNEEILPAGLAALCRKSDEEAIRSPNPVQSEEPVTGKDGTTLFLDTVKVPIHDQSGNLTGLVTVSRDITERKRTEARITRINRQRELILNAAGEGIFGLNRDGNITFINPAGAKMVGWNAEDLIGRPSHDLLHHSRPDGSRYPSEECPLHKSMQKKTIHHIRDEVFWRRDGTSFPLEYVSTPIVEGATVVGAVIVFKDITDRKRADEEARMDQRRVDGLLKISQHKSASPQELLSAAVDEAVALSDSALGYIKYYDEEKREFTLHAWSRDVMRECSIADKSKIWRLNDAGIWAETVRQRKPIIVNDFVASNPLKRGFPDGHIKLFRFMTLPVFSDDRIVAVVAVANKKSEYNEMDVRQLALMMDSIWKLVELKFTEQALRISEERLRLALFAANQGLYDLNVQTGEAAVSHEYATMLGYDPAEFRETNDWWIERLHPDDRERVSAVYRDYISGKIPNYTVEFRQKTRTGEWKWILSLGKIVQWDAGGKPLRMLGTHTDITERRKLLEQLESLNRNLSERVREQIEKNRINEQLIQLQSRHAAMGEMIDNIAHQWRQPLNNLGLIMQGMRMKFNEGTLTPEKMQENVKNGMSMIQYMSQTVNDFTNFFRPDKALAIFPIKEVVNAALGFMETSLKRNGIELVADIAEDIAVKGYRNEYTQVLVNILNNARDVLVERGVQTPAITLSAFKEDHFSVLTITDNGGGISDKLMPNIFYPYFTTKAPNKGTGIGLYMSKTIIENNMGGRLSVCNRGSGAEFRIEVRNGE